MINLLVIGLYKCDNSTFPLNIRTILLNISKKFSRSVHKEFYVTKLDVINYLDIVKILNS